MIWPAEKPGSGSIMVTGIFGLRTQKLVHGPDR
jgi:hypothetical protein